MSRGEFSMKEAFLNRSMSLITSYNDSYSEEEKEKMRYGLEGFYLTIFKTIIIFAIAILFGMFTELLLLMILYNFLRFFAFGFHANSSNACLAFSMMLFLVFPLAVFKNYISLQFSPIICLFCLVAFMLFAPSDTIKRPLTNKRKRSIRKCVSSVIAFIYTLICIVSDNTLLVNCLTLSIVSEMVMINPITYKIFGQPYNNYKTSSWC